MSTPFDPNFPERPLVQPVHIDDQPISMRTSALQGPVAPLGTNPAATTANTDYSFGWLGNALVNHVLLQNNTAASINYDIDNAATAGSPVLAAGQIVFLDVTMQKLHLLSAATQNVNGNVAANIVVRGWL